MTSKQMETKFEEANIEVLRKRSKEDIVVNVEEEMEFTEDQQVTKHSNKIHESGMKGIDTSLTSEEKENIIASSSRNNVLLNHMKEILDETNPSLSSKYCIYRVPYTVRKVKEEAYDPRVLSIGPFHHHKKGLQSLDAFKFRYFKKLVQRNSSRVSLEKYVEFLRDQEESVRQCYSEVVEMGSDDFLKMLLLDSCFIIELFLGFYYKGFRDEDYFGLRSARLCENIRHDLILLENQIPFFILEGLFNLSLSGFSNVPLLLELVISFFGSSNTQNKTYDEINSIMHFTDLILIFYRPKGFPMISNHVEHTTTDSTAIELDEAGVKFVMSSSKCLLDIKFTSSGVLEIPHLSLYDMTESMMRNLIALEICHCHHDSYMIDFFFFMDHLVNTSKDVDLLVQNGIVKNGIGDSKQVAVFYNSMCTNVWVSKYKFSGLSEELNEYCKIPRHKWRAALKREYFSTPWRGASTSAAIILLVLTFIQAVCSVISVAKGG